MNAALCDRNPVEEAGRVLRQGHPRNFALDLTCWPAYKDSRVRAATTMATATSTARDIRYCSNRKGGQGPRKRRGRAARKPHYDGDRVMIIEDVTTSRKSMRRPIPSAQGQREAVGLIVSLNPHGAEQGTKGALMIQRALRLPHRGHRDHGGLDGAPLQPRMQWNCCD